MPKIINDGLNSHSRYEKKLKKVQIRFNTDYEQYLVDYLETKENKSEYIKNLIKADMERNKRS